MNSLDHFCTVEHIFMWITTSIIACEMQKTEVEEESVVCHLCRELQLARTKFCVKWTLSRYSTQHIVLLRLSATSCVTDMLGAEWQINDATCSSDDNTPKVHLYHYLLFHTVYGFRYNARSVITNYDTICDYGLPGGNLDLSISIATTLIIRTQMGHSSTSGSDLTKAMALKHWHSRRRLSGYARRNSRFTFDWNFFMSNNCNVIIQHNDKFL